VGEYVSWYIVLACYVREAPYVDINFVSLVWIHLEMMSLDVLGVGGMSCECGVTVEILRKMGGCL
jgi:hypothetical protein